MNAFKGKRILIVEDSRFLAQITANILNKYGYMNEIALTGEEAVEKVCGSQCPDLILMDIELGKGMDGALAARTIQQFRDVPVVFLTAHTEQEIVEKIRSVTGYGYVLKGAGEHVLVSTVEMALRLYEANAHANMYRRIFEDSLNEIYIFHPETLKFIAVNRGARENLGYTIEELSTMTPLDLKPELDLQSFRELLAPLVSGEQEQVLLNTVHRRKDGSLYPAEVHLQLFEHSGEKVCLALIIDLSERRQMEEELRAREATLSAIMGSARDAIVMLDGQGNVTFWNPAAEQLFGYSREEILGKDLHRLVVPDECLYQAYNKAFKHFQLTGEGNAIGKTIELKAKHKDGRELDVELSLSALRIRDAWHAVGIVRDISERKRLEAELSQARRDWLAQSQRRMGTDDAQEEQFGGVRQSLLMMNGDLVRRAVNSQQQGLLRSLIASELPFDKKVEHLFLAALSRPPSRRELRAAQELLATSHHSEPVALEDIWWALLNSSEFLLDH
ncbi:MAG: PAS domain S-box protein [Firmicutes bacterium]|nr:PAS domain S-box protein [Bacillota bacterium]